MTHLSDVLSKQREQIEWCGVCERRQKQYTAQIKIMHNELFKTHKILMTRVFREIKQSKWNLKAI